MTLGSLFDGSGGFPLAGILHGIKPVWASEIEPYPLKVTAERFPDMRQLGDITNVNGAYIDPVHIISFGSPCQDLSIAGKQAGIHDGERSNLFFHAVRIISEMRKSTNGKYPRFAVWENVPGAFSSNKGHDFQAVLEALCRIIDPEASVPMSPKNKWQHAGCIVGNGYSVAWRQYDAQFWGVPQRRKRIYLIADFGSERAGEILFERESVCGDSSEGREEKQRIAADVEGSAGRSDRVVCLTPWDCQSKRQYSVNGAWPTLDAGESGGGQAHGVCYAVDCRNIKANEELSATIQAKDGGGYSLNYVNPVVYDERGNGDGRIVPTLTGDHENRITDYTALCVGNGQLHQISMSEQANTLDCMHDQQAIVIPTHQRRKYILRRLTPLECCRLQGFPDWWEDGVLGSDTARFKMWGNGIALPCASGVLGKIANYMKENVYEKEGII